MDYFTILEPLHSLGEQYAFNYAILKTKNEMKSTPSYNNEKQ
jgi:hypothetical protein